MTKNTVWVTIRYFERKRIMKADAAARKNKSCPRKRRRGIVFKVYYRLCLLPAGFFLTTKKEMFLLDCPWTLDTYYVHSSAVGVKKKSSSKWGEEEEKGENSFKLSINSE